MRKTEKPGLRCRIVASMAVASIKFPRSSDDPMIRPVSSENHGRPAIAATARPGEFSGRNVERASAAGETYHAPKMSPQEARGPSAGNHGVNDSARNDNPKPNSRPSKQEKQAQKKAQKQEKAEQKREAREDRR